MCFPVRVPPGSARPSAASRRLPPALGPWPLSVALARRTFSPLPCGARGGTRSPARRAAARATTGSPPARPPTPAIGRGTARPVSRRSGLLSVGLGRGTLGLRPPLPTRFMYSLRSSTVGPGRLAASAARSSCLRRSSCMSALPQMLPCSSRLWAPPVTASAAPHPQQSSPPNIVKSPRETRPTAGHAAPLIVAAYLIAIGMDFGHLLAKGGSCRAGQAALRPVPSALLRLPRLPAASLLISRRALVPVR